MRETTSFHRRATAARTRLRVESLEGRAVPSTTVSETEPNNTVAAADAVPLGFDVGEDTNVTVKGAVSPLGDRDWFGVQLNAGDVIGGAVRATQAGLNPTVRLIDAAAKVLWHMDDHNYLASLRPPESPLPNDQSSATNSIFDYVINTAGSYYIEVAASADATAGSYQMDLVVARPGLEAAPVGTRQILFVDFDGATSNAFGGGGVGQGQKTLSALSSFLAAWGLTAADEDAVIDAILAGIKENLSTDVRTRGLNGDYARTGVPGQFDIEIRNSRDDPDEFGRNPFVSRVIIGGTQAELGFQTVGIAQYIDPGNFSFDDDAVVLLDRLSGPATTADPASLNRYGIRAPHTKIELIGMAVGALAAHEAGHTFGNWHTDVSLDDPFSGVPNIMDPARVIVQAIGPDGIFGTRDDVDVDFGVDGYFAGQGWLGGVEDTLNVVAFGLSTGKGTVSRGGSSGGGHGGGGGGGGSSGYEFSGPLALSVSDTRWTDTGASPLGWLDDRQPPTPGAPQEHAHVHLRDAPLDEAGHLSGHDHSEGVMIETAVAAERWAVGGVYVGRPGEFLAPPLGPDDGFPDSAIGRHKR